MTRLGKKIDWSVSVDVSEWGLGEEVDDEVYGKISEVSILLQQAMLLTINAVIKIALEEEACISIDDTSQPPTAMKVGFPLGHYEHEMVYWKVDLHEIVDDFIYGYTAGKEPQFVNNDEDGTIARATGLRDALREMADKLDRHIPKEKT